LPLFLLFDSTIRGPVRFCHKVSSGGRGFFGRDFPFPESAVTLFLPRFPRVHFLISCGPPRMSLVFERMLCFCVLCPSLHANCPFFPSSVVYFPSSLGFWPFETLLVVSPPPWSRFLAGEPGLSIVRRSLEFSRALVAPLFLKNLVCFFFFFSLTFPTTSHSWLQPSDLVYPPAPFWYFLRSPCCIPRHPRVYSCFVRSKVLLRPKKPSPLRPFFFSLGQSKRFFRLLVAHFV